MGNLLSAIGNMEISLSPARCNSPQSCTDDFNTATPNLADLLADLPPSQLSIDALNTATLNLADLLAQRVFYMKDLLPARVTISFLAYLV